MMYNQKLVASLKANGKILREFKDTVYVPFGSEYSIVLKNLNTVRAIVNVTIDGQDMVPGGLVINAGQTVDLERSIKNNNLTEGNKFKFIERTGAVEAHRGVKLEDGIVRIEYQFERPVPQWKPTTVWGPVYRGISGTGDWFGSNTIGNPLGADYYDTGGKLRRVDTSKGASLHATAAASIDQYCAINNIQSKAEVHDGAATMDCFNDVGITVPGSKSEQKFVSVSEFAVEAEKHVIVLKMLGETPDNKPVAQPVTVKHKPKCTTCGKQNKAHAKFCTECGTALEIFA